MTKERSERDQIIKDLCQKIELLEKKVESLSEQENVKNKSPDVSSRYVVHPELYHGENNVPNNLVDSHDFYMSKNPSVNKVCSLQIFIFVNCRKLIKNQFIADPL